MKEELNKKWRIKNKRETALQRGDRRQILSHTQHSYHMYKSVYSVYYTYTEMYTQKTYN